MYRSKYLVRQLLMAIGCGCILMRSLALADESPPNDDATPSVAVELSDGDANAGWLVGMSFIWATGRRPPIPSVTTASAAR
jgi:hypothetical protein